MKRENYWENNIEREFGVEIHSYDRPGTWLLITAGFGMGMGLMDVIPQCRYFFDTDNYRGREIDWECLGVRLSFVGLQKIILAGWFTVDDPVIFNKLGRGILIPKFTYLGGHGVSLQDFIKQCVAI